MTPPPGSCDIAGLTPDVAKRSVNHGVFGREAGHTGRMTTPSRALRRRAVAGALAGALVFAACGGSDDSSGSDDAASADAQVTTPPDDVDVDPAADTVANQLPDVVVDDLQRGNKVNLRNFAPSDTPILLWMWAPH